MELFNDRLFEIPYNFCKNLIYTLKTLEVSNNNIYCIYLPAFHRDYQTGFRGVQDKTLIFDQQQYYDHINFLLRQGYQNKLQLLLQSTNPETNMQKDILSSYIKLGFTKFCVGNIEQGLIIKDIFPEADIVGSITMHTTKEDIENNLDLYKDIFTSLVLDFSYYKNINKIKELPKEFKYIMLINSLCNVKCRGDNHWRHKNPDGSRFHQEQCPGLFPFYQDDFNLTCLFRPMDLHLFDPYTFAYKLQDRGWPTNMIIRDLILYTTDYSYYPDIIYNEKLYLPKDINKKE